MEDNKSKNIIIPKWVAVILILSLLFNIVMYSSISSLKREISNLQNSINSASNNINNTLSNYTSHINDMLKKEESLAVDFKYDFVGYKDKRVDLLLSLKPKVYTKGDKIYFSYKIGNNPAKLIEALPGEVGVFNSTINISVFDNIDLDLVIENGSTKKIEKLYSIYNLLEEFTAQLNGGATNGTYRYSQGESTFYITNNYTLTNNSKDIDISDVKLEIALNDKVIDSMAMLKDSNSFNDFCYKSYSIELKGYKVKSNVNDKINIYITAKDSKGFNYKVFIDSWIIGEKGELKPQEFINYGKVEVN